jgi:NADPH:quinone reductase
VTTAPGPSLLVRTRGAAVNFADVLLCRGEYQAKPALPFTPGIELCGDVLAVGNGVAGVAPGDRVLGTSRMPSGGFAELAVMNAGSAWPTPASLDDAEAAAFFISYQTGWFGLHRRAALQAGETLLVHAAAGGVGSAAVQLGKAAGAIVIGVAGGPAKAEVVRGLGADLAIDYRCDDFVELVNEVTGGRGADVIYDPVGGETYARSTKCIAYEGRIIIVGFASGDTRRPALSHAMVKNYSLLGLHWGLYAKRHPEAVQRCHARLTDLADQGLIRPVIDKRMKLSAALEAVDCLAHGEVTGRSVLLGATGEL